MNEPKRAPRWVDSVGALGLAILLIFVLMALVPILKPGPLTANVLQQLTFLAAAILAIRLGRLDPAAIRLRRPRAVPTALCCVGAAAVMLALWTLQPFLADVYESLEWDFTKQIKEQERAIQDAQAQSPVVSVLVFTAGAAVCEEALFRLVVLAGFVNSMGRVTGLILTTVVFAAMHLVVPQAINVLVIGLYLGAAVLITGSVWTGVAMHYLNNVLALSMPEPRGSNMLVFAAATVAAVGALMLANRLAGKSPAAPEGAPAP